MSFKKPYLKISRFLSDSQNLKQIRIGRRIIPLFLLVLLLCGCNRNKVQIGEVSNMSYKGTENNSIVFEADILIDNPKIFKIIINQIDASVFVNKLTMGKISKIDTLVIPAKTKQTYKVKMYLELTNMAGGLLAVIQMFGKKRNVYEIKGIIKIKYFIFTRTIELKKKTKSRSSKKKHHQISDTTKIIH